MRVYDDETLFESVPVLNSYARVPFTRVEDENVLFNVRDGGLQLAIIST
jgi:hypothetical protein